MGAISVVHEHERARSQPGQDQTTPGQHQLSPRQWSNVCRGIGMSLREQQVCQLLFDGLTRQKIAEQIGISNRTVRHYMEQIHVKLGVCNRVGVVLQIVQLRDLLDSAPLISSQVQPPPNKKVIVHERRTQPSEA